KFSANAQGRVTITNLFPAGQTQVVVQDAQGKGTQFFDDETVRRSVDNEIRECMKTQWSAVLPVVLNAAPTRVFKVCIGTGGGASCLSGADAYFDCDRYGQMGGGSKMTYDTLRKMFCQDDSGVVTHDSSVGGGYCGWTQFTVACYP